MKISAGQSLGRRGEIQAMLPLRSLGVNDRKDKFADLGSAVLRPHIL